MLEHDDQKGDSPIFFKDLRRVWTQFGDLYDNINNLLIDDSPEKTIVNLPHTTLFSSPFYKSTDSEQDTFLLSILWPCQNWCLHLMLAYI